MIFTNFFNLYVFGMLFYITCGTKKADIIFELCLDVLDQFISVKAM